MDLKRQKLRDNGLAFFNEITGYFLLYACNDCNRRIKRNAVLF